MGRKSRRIARLLNWGEIVESQPTFAEVVRATMDRRGQQIADAVMANNGLLQHLKDGGRVTVASEKWAETLDEISGASARRRKAEILKPPPQPEPWRDQQYDRMVKDFGSPAEDRGSINYLLNHASGVLRVCVAPAGWSVWRGSDLWMSVP